MTKARACEGAHQERSPRVTFHVATLTLGLWPKQGLVKVRTKIEAQESHFMLPGVWESVKEWTPTLLSELPLWKLGSWWTPKFSESIAGVKTHWIEAFFYIIGKILEFRCLKWAFMTHLGSSNISYGQKKGWESNWQFDFRPLKFENRPNFLVCRWCATYRWKVLDEGYNFFWDLTSIKGLHTKLWAPKVVRVSTLGISGLPHKNDIRVLVSWPST